MVCVESLLKYGAVVAWTLCWAAVLTAQSRPVTLDNSLAVAPTTVPNVEWIRHSTSVAARKTEQFLAQLHPAFDRELSIGELSLEMARLGISLRVSDDCDMTQDTQVDLRVRGPESLAYRLERVLAENDCSILIDEQGHLLVISNSEATELPQVVIYDVTELSDQLNGAGMLIVLIQNSVEPLDWDEENFDINAFAVKDRRMLSVAAPYPLQIKVRRYLNDLAAMSGSPRGVAASETSSEGLNRPRAFGSSPVVVPLPESQVSPNSMPGGLF